MKLDFFNELEFLFLEKIEERLHNETNDSNKLPLQKRKTCQKKYII